MGKDTGNVIGVDFSSGQRHVDPGDKDLLQSRLNHPTGTPYTVSRAAADTVGGPYNHEDELDEANPSGSTAEVLGMYATDTDSDPSSRRRGLRLKKSPR
jgi:hypothetical protein